MRKCLLLVSVLMVAACSGVKRTQEALNTGNYPVAIQKAVKNLQQNKTRKGNQPYVLMLEDAFAKNMQREEEQIRFLQKDGNPANLETIYNKYLNLKQIQNQIQPLLPLYVQNEGRDARFDFVNYDNAILQTKDELSEYLYDNALNTLANAKYKQDYRSAYNELDYLQKINPGYSETVQSQVPFGRPHPFFAR
ncbi:MAG: hypothetical protein AAGL29_13115, partial [Bacteroidota bacterium]